jgi:hypothetical protein
MYCHAKVDGMILESLMSHVSSTVLPRKFVSNMVTTGHVLIHESPYVKHKKNSAFSFLIVCLYLPLLSILIFSTYAFPIPHLYIPLFPSTQLLFLPFSKYHLQAAPSFCSHKCFTYPYLSQNNFLFQASSLKLAIVV